MKLKEWISDFLYLSRLWFIKKYHSYRMRGEGDEFLAIYIKCSGLTDEERHKIKIDWLFDCYDEAGMKDLFLSKGKHNETKKR